jgi:hypothetical protein
MPFDIQNKTKQKPICLIRSLTTQEILDYLKKVKKPGGNLQENESGLEIIGVRLEEGSLNG